jgi:Asp-tRNA(Asn)/Glu-tRNA(Gln) amidotransferase A subunit family amidase
VQRTYSPRSLVGLVREIEKGRLTSLAAFDAFAARAAEVEPAVKAFAHTDWDGARATVGKRSGLPLHGLPIGIKDIIDTSFLPTSLGSPIHAGRRPAKDAPVVRMVADAGGSTPVKTTTTEFAFLNPTETRNPADLARSPGGSSSGSAAAVAAGMLPAAIGSQTGGSVVRPASFCGVTGFKPTIGTFSTDGVMAFAPSFDTVGLFAAGVEDVRLLWAALRREAYAPSGLTVRGLRVGLVRTPWDDLASGPAQGALNKCGAAIDAAGVSLADIALPDDLAVAQDAHLTIQGFEVTPLLAAERRAHREELSPILAGYLDEAAEVDAAAHAAAIAVRDAARSATARLFADFDMLMTFASADVAPAEHSTGTPAFNKLWTLLGVPAISVSGASAGGLPIGVQLVGRMGGDDALLEAAVAIERTIAGIDA